jgi:energy-coupling factor transporter ATP-binding protein EcfA2
MSDSALRSLRIAHLRGSTVPFVLPFDEGKTLTIIYGENGTGKSTICDALELIGKGKVGSLDNRGLGQTSRYWPSLGRTRADSHVELEAGSGACRATLGANGVVVSPPERRPRVEVLRRSQILAMIEATPSKRYEAIKRFVDVEGVEKSEAQLRELIKLFDRDHRHAATRVQENRDTLQQFWEAAGRPGPDAIRWAEVETARDPSVLEAEIAGLDNLSAAFLRLADYPDRLETAESELAHLREQRSQAQEELKRHLSTSALDTAELMEMLRSAARYLALHQAAGVCPLCESAERADGLANRIEARLGAFAAVQQAQAAVEAREGEVRRAEIALADLRASVRGQAVVFEDQRGSTEWPAGLPLPGGPAPTDPSELRAWLAANNQLLPAWKRAGHLREDRRSFLHALSMAVATHAENVETQKEIETLLPRLRRALEIVEEERRRFTDETLAAISDEVGRLYEAVHPGEGLNKISLILDPRRRASLEIGASFGGRSDSPPQAYFSDSHLDTLGLCIFLALAALDEPAETILVLDDVLASVDEPHAERLLEMLCEQAGRFRQCVLTTHYRPWREKLRRGWPKDGRCHYVELSTWSESGGLALVQDLPAEAR